MPIPGSVLSNLLPASVQDIAGNMYPSLATLRPVTVVRSTAGQNKHTYADSTDSTQINLACRLSPLILVRPQDQERQLNGDERAVAMLQLNFATYVPVPVQTLLLWQVKVDGTVYQIRAAENDGSRLTTRFMVSNVNQFEG